MIKFFVAIVIGVFVTALFVHIGLNYGDKNISVETKVMVSAILGSLVSWLIFASPKSSGLD